MNLKGLQYLADNQGNKVKVVVDLTLYGKEFAVFAAELAKKYANTTTSNSPFDTNTTSPPPTTNANSSRQAKVDGLLNTARTYIGTPYVTGGTTKSGMDCSGFTMVAFSSINVVLPRVSRDQASVGTAVAKNQIQPGDLMYFSTTTPGVVNHVGIASQVKPNGEVLFIHASSSRGVMEATMSLDYWQKAYMGARRVF